jgi:hypothetical protein
MTTFTKSNLQDVRKDINAALAAVAENMEWHYL